MKNRSLRAQRFVPVLSVLSLAVAASVQAQEIEINPVVVSASRMEQPLSEVLSSVSVITRAEIDKSQAVTLADLLQGEAGFEYGRSGGPGTTTSFFLRGQESKNVVVLIDGVRSQIDGNASLTVTDVPLAQVERIEVLRGNAGALYGESAIGGVINIITRAGKDESRAYGAAHAGSYKTEGLDVGYGGRVQDISFDLNVGYSGTAGFSAMDPTGRTRVNPDRDGYRNRFAAAKAEQKVDNTLKVGVRANMKESWTDYDNSSSPDVSTDVHQFKIKTDSVGGYLKKSVTDQWLTNIDLTSANYSYEAIKNGTVGSTGYYDGHQDAVRWSNAYELLSSTSLSFGVDAAKEKFTQSSSYDMTRNLTGYYAGVLATEGKWSFQGNARHDALTLDRVASGVSTSKSYSSNNYLVGAGYQINDQWRVTSTISTGFRAPSVAELYGWGGNANLKPETHRSEEFGLVYSNADALMRLVYFQTRTSDAIGYDSNWTNANVGEIRNKGYELTAHSQFMGNTFKGSLVLQDPWNVTDNYLPGRRAKQYGSIDLSRWIQAHEVGVKVFASGERSDFNMAQSPMLSGYSTVAFYVNRKIDANWIGRLKLENAFDRHYALAGGYNTPGRGLYLTLQYSPK